MKQRNYSINKTIKQVSLLLFILLQIQVSLLAQTSFSAVSNGLPAAYRMDVADLENDNDLDVVLSKSGVLGLTIEVYTNDGSGTFTKLNTPIFDNFGMFVYDVAFIDIEGDNDQDILVIGQTFIAGVGSTALFRNDGGGTFTKLSGTPFQDLIGANIAIGDLDNDNDLDVIAMGTITGGSSVIPSVFTNDGSGNFTATSNLANDNNQRPVIGKLDNDNINDYIIANHLDTKDLFGNLSTPTVFPSLFDSYEIAILTDVDGDNDLDIVVDSLTATVIFLNNGSGSFTKSSVTLAGTDVGALVAGDIDGDGDQDIYRKARNVALTGYEGGFYINDGGGNFYIDNNSISTPDIIRADAFLEDFNGDNYPDLLLTDNSSQATYYYQNDFTSFSHPDRALDLDGTNVYTTSHETALNTLPLTIEFWMQRQSINLTSGIMDKLSGGNGFSIGTLGTELLFRYEIDGSNYIHYSSGNALTYNTNWHHVAFVIETTGLTVFVDGIETGTATWTGTPSAISNTTGLRLGNWTINTVLFDGNLDEVRLWNTARTQAEIVNNMCNVIPTPANNANLVTYYSINDYLDNTAVIFDESQYNHPMTISGGTQTLVAEQASCTPPVLPVELTFFKGKVLENSNLLQWQTATEENNEGFYIEKSVDGENWQTLGFVAGNGTTMEVSNYEFIDDELSNSQNYYRLKQIDLPTGQAGFDGNFEYSSVIHLTIQPFNHLTIKIFPNPTRDFITIEINEPTTNLSRNLGIQIINAYGQIVKEAFISNTEKINVSDLSSGIYFVKIGQTTKKITIQQ